MRGGGGGAASWIALTACMLGLGSGCAGDSADDRDGGDAGGVGPLDPDVAYVSELRALEDIAALSTEEEPGTVKYLARIEGADVLEPLDSRCYFQNMNRFPWHLQFLHSFRELRGATLDSYRNWVLRPGTRRLWGGTLRSFRELRHPTTRAPGVIAYDVYAEPGGLDVDDVAAALAQLERCAPFAKRRLAFLPAAPDQDALVERERTALAARGIAVVLPDDLPHPDRAAMREQENEP